MGTKAHIQWRGFSGPQRVMSANGRQKGAAHACESCKPRWNHQITDLIEIFKKKIARTTLVPEVSDESMTACNARGTTDVRGIACMNET